MGETQDQGDALRLRWVHTGTASLQAGYILWHLWGVKRKRCLYQEASRFGQRQGTECSFVISLSFLLNHRPKK